ncbi:MAG TPA: IPT/TIG domain-containing protein [Thermoanaerobaculia bacterium]|nr:IPT/TIG domain-containing protein [Thermoanaerobaculia bacterium]
MARSLAAALFAAVACLITAAAYGQVDLAVSSVSASPAAITLNTGDVQYFVSTYNFSGSSATNASLTASLPAGSTFVSANTTGGGSCSNTVSTVTCSWATYASGLSATTTITVTPGAAGANTLSATIGANESDPVPANNSGSASATVNAQIDLSVVSVTASPTNITLGTGNVQYFVSLYNYSSSKATNAVVTANLPASSTFVSATATGGGTCGQSAGVVTCNWPDYFSGSSFTVIITVTPGAAGSNTLSASIAADQGDPVPANNSGNASCTVNDQIDLSVVSVTASPTNITLGTGNVQYFVSLYNYSTSKATNAVMTASLPASSTFVSATATGGGTCGQSAGVVTCSWPDYFSGSSFTVTITVTPGAAGANTLSASVTADQPDPTPANNGGSTSVTVNSQIDLSVVSVTASPTAFTLGTGNVQYFVSLYNYSTSKATNAVMTANLPASSTYVSATATGGGTCGQSAGVVTCSWPDYFSGSSFNVTITVTPGAAGSNTLSASIAAEQTDPIPANNSGSAIVTVNDQIDLAVVSVSASPTNITLGTGNVQYFVSLYNYSTSKATNAVMTANLPASSTYVSATATGGGTCGQSAGVVTCNWPDYFSGSSFSVIITVTPGAAGANTLSASIAADQADPVPANNSGSTAVTVNDQIDLSVISVTASPTTITLGGGNVQFFVNLYNYSSSKATNAAMTASLPASSAFVSATATGGGTCSQSAGVVTCNWTDYFSGNSNTATITITPGAAGANTLSASIAADQADPTPANNSGSTAVTVNPSSAPVITSFAPASGPTGTGVTLTGSNFTGATAVKFFNNVTASFTVVNDTTITTTVPAGATTGAISATNAIGTGSSATNFTVVPAPSIASFSPTNAGIGVSVVITGNAFTGATAVTFNGTSASYTVDSATQITAVVPSGATSGPIAITTSAGTGTSASNFTVNAPTTITAVASGLWSSGTTWSGGVPPGTLDTAVINAAVVVAVSSNATVANLTLSNGTLKGLANLTVTGTMNWSGDSTLQESGSITIPVGATLNISGSGTRFLDVRTIHNAGTINWSGANISEYNNALIDNQSGALFLASGDNFIYNHCGCSAPQTISNNGTFRKQGTGGTTQIFQSFSSLAAGSVDIQSGTVVFNSGTIAGAINVASGATLSVPSGASTAINSTVFLGNGTLSVSGGTLSVGGNLSIQAMTFSGGFVTGAGDLSTTASGAITWSADSTFTGSGSVTIPAGGQLNITGSGTRFIDGRTLHNAGTINWGGADISAYNASLVDNQTGGLIAISADKTWYNHCGCTAAQTTVNNGTIRKTGGSGTSTIQNALTSSASGAVDIQSGTLTFRNASVSSPISESGTGTLALDGSTSLTLNGITQTGANGIVQNGGTLTVTGNVVVANYTISNGFLTGSGDLKPSAGGAVNWTGNSNFIGSAGTGSVTIPAGTTLNITGTGTRFLDGRTLHVAGTFNWGTADLSAYDNSLVDIQTGGILAIQGDQLWYNHCGCTAAQTTTNNGTIRKLGTSGTTTINNALTSAAAASIDIQSGTLILRNATVSSPITETGTGVLSVDASTSLTLNAVTQTGANGIVQTGGTLTVTGTVNVDNYTISAGTLTGSGDLKPTVGAAVNWTGNSTFTGSGSVTIQAGAALNISGTGTRFLDGRTIHNGGTLTWSGADISAYDASLIDNQSGALWLIQTDNQIYNHCGCTAAQTTVNNGTIRKQTTSGTTTINNSLSSAAAAAIDIQSGTLLLRNATVASPVTESGSATLLVDGSTNLTLSATSVTGASGVVQTGGTLNISGTVNVDKYALSAGTLAGNGTLQLTAGGTLSWSGDSTWLGSGGGSVSIPTGAFLNISGTGTRFLDGRVLHNAGTLTWSGANISSYNAALIDNTGLLDIVGDGTVYNHCGCTAAQTTTNSGTLRKETATGTTSWTLPFSNSGTIDAESGTLAFGGALALTNVTQFGIGSAATYGRIIAGGAVSLGGTLTAAPTNGFVPQGGDVYTIITGGSVSGSFATKNLSFGAGRSFGDNTTATTVKLTASGPSITTVNPNHGPTAGGTAVAIAGSGFAAGGSFAVTFGGTAATCSVTSATQIDCTAPSHPAGTVDVVVTNGDGQPTTKTSAYTFDTSPTFGFARPASGGIAGGSAVVIGGTNLDTLTSVTFGGAAATIVYSSATEITVTAPAHAAGAVNIVLTNAIGTATAANAFTYVDNDDAARDFSVAVNPSPRWSYGSEPFRGGTFTLFTGPGRNGPGMDSWPNNGSLPIVQHNPTGSTIQQATNFTPSGKMILHPGSAGENAVVRWTAPANAAYRIAGNFVGYDSSYPTTTDVAVLHNNNAGAPLFTGNIASDNVPLTFSVDVNANAGDTVEFTVGFGSNGNFSGDATGLDALVTTLTGPAVTVTGVAPPSGLAGTSVTISGTNFHSGAAVTFGGVAATGITVVDPNTIQCTTPAHAPGAVDVVVTHPDSAAATLTNGFTYTSPTVDLAVTPAATPPSVAVGGTITFTTTVKNNGTGGATGVSLTQSVPANLTLATGPTPSQGTCSGTTTITCTLGALASTASATVTFTATATAGGTAITTASATANESDTNATDNTNQAASAAVTSTTIIVRTNADSGTGSLRQAILDADSGVCGPNCIIGFNVPAGQETISISTSLPSLTGMGIFVDGQSQPTYPGTRITIDGANDTQTNPVLELNGQNHYVRGMAIVRGHVEGVRVTGGGSHQLIDVWVGTADGNTAAGNFDGVVIDSGGNIISNDVISGNNGSGVVVKGSFSNAAIVGNKIGTNAAGTAALPNHTDGIQFILGAHGSSAGGNVISGNTNSGVYVNGAPGIANVINVSGNKIGTNAAGTAAIPNGAGVTLTNTTGSIVSNNLLSGNTNAGLVVGSGATNTTIQGNLIGTDLSNTGAIPNGKGIDIQSGASGAHIDSANTIAYNGAQGIKITGGPTAIVIANNSIHDNGALGIDLGGDGPTANDLGDADTGDNNLQNFPDFVDATLAGSTLTVHVNVDSSAVASTQSLRVELFKNGGITPLGSQCFAGNSITNGAITITGTPLVVGDSIVATATSFTNPFCLTANDGTSEFSAPITLGACTPPSATITPSGPTTFCAGGSVTLTAAAGAASYLWSNGATTQSISVNASGTFSVTATSAGGCSATSSPVTVTVNSAPPTPTITPGGPTNFCSGGSVTLTASAASSWHWSTGATTQSIVVTSSGSYSVTVTNGNGCSATSTPAAVTVNAPPNPTITPSGPTTFCSGGSVTLTASAATSWLWSNGATTQSIAVSATGSYSVTASDAAGCTATSAPTVVTVNPPPVVTISGPSSICPNAGFTLDAGAGFTSYAWSTGATTRTITVSQTAATTYSVTVTSISGCSGSGSKTVSMGSGGTTTIAAPAAVPANSIGNHASVTAGPAGTTYAWTISNGSITAGQGTPSITFAAGSSGTLTLGVTVDNAGCLSTGSANVSVSSLADLSISIAGPSSVNAGAPLAYVISVSNLGPTAAQNVVVADTLPNGVVFGSATGNGWNCASQGNLVGCTTPAISVGNASSITINATAPSSGPVTNTVTISANTPDPKTSNNSASITTTVNDSTNCSHAPATPMAPANNSTSNTSAITFQWTAAAGASGYRLFASTNGAPFADLGTTQATALPVSLTNGTIEWFVQTLFDNCPSIDSPHFLFTIPRPQSCPTNASQLQSPVNATLDHSPVRFDWSAAPNATQYELWLSLDHAAPALLGVTNATSLTRQIAAGAAEWFVVARYDACPGVESAHASFILAPDPNCSTKSAMLIEPGDNTVVDGRVAFHWSAVPGASQYQLFAGVNGAPPALIASSSQLRLERDLEPGAWQWFIVATFGSGCSPTQSAPGFFTVLPALPPCAPPATPVVRASANASSNNAYTIRWNRVGNAGAYEIQEGDAQPEAVNGTEKSYTHANTGNAPLLFNYRVRAVGSCDASVKSAFSSPIVVAVLPTQTTNGATPADDPQPVAYTLNIPTQAGQPFTATANQPWISIDPSSGTTTGDTLTLTVTANTSDLPAGTSTASISVLFGSARAHGTSSATTVNVNLVQPVSPGSKNTPPPDALIIPAVAHAGGINSNFQSDVRVANTGPQAQKYQLTFSPDEGTPKSTTVSIDPGKTLALDDILATWFGNGTSSIGTLEIRPMSTTTGTPSITTFAASRTYNVTANGTFGQYIPAIPFSQFIAKNGLISLQQIASSDAFRTNLGLLEGSGDPASVLISVFGNDGTKLTEFTQTLTGGQHLQMNGILAVKGFTNLTDGRIEVKVTSAGGKVTAYASVLDNATNDPLLVAPVSISTTGAPKYVLPGIADLNNGIANWRSDVRIFNPSASTVNATATFYPLNGGDPTSKQLTINPNEVRQLDSALSTLFNITNAGGALHITTDNNAPLVATARTYNQTTAGTYGQFIPAVTTADAVGKGGRALQILQVEESDRFRSNIGITEVTGKKATVEVSAVTPDSKFAVTGTFEFAPNEYRQYSSMLKSLGLDTAYNTRVTVRVIDGDGKVTAYASVIDQKTQDPNYVKAQ